MNFKILFKYSIYINFFISYVIFNFNKNNIDKVINANLYKRNKKKKKYNCGVN